MTDIPFPVGDLREAGLQAARLGQTAEQNGDLIQAINLYRQSIHYLERAGAPEAAQVWQRLTAAELKLRLEPDSQAQGDNLKNMIDRMADMNDKDLAAYLEQLAKEMAEDEAGEPFE